MEVAEVEIDKENYTIYTIVGLPEGNLGVTEGAEGELYSSQEYNHRVRSHEDLVEQTRQSLNLIDATKDLLKNLSILKDN